MVQSDVELARVNDLTTLKRKHCKITSTTDSHGKIEWVTRFLNVRWRRPLQAASLSMPRGAQKTLNRRFHVLMCITRYMATENCKALQEP
jgi:hypothetical protein